MKALNDTLGLALVALVIAAAWIVMLTIPVEAASGCAPRPIVLQQLADRYGESPRGIGLAGNGAVVEVFASVQTGTWSIAATLADGMTCLVASGQNWEDIAAVVIPQGEEG